MINKELYNASNCDICESNENKLLYTVHGYNLVKCINCGLVYVNPRIKSPDNIYTDSYFKDGHGYSDYVEGGKAYCKAFKRTLKSLNKYNRHQRGSLLEIGCAAGFFLKEAEKDGWVVKGIELNSQMAKFARNELKLDVISASVYDSVYERESFDCICFIDCLEHLDKPRLAVQKAFQQLKPNGILLIAVPDIEGWFARLAGSRWHLINPEEHLYYFNKKTITKLLEQLDFCDIKISPHYYGRTLAELFDSTFFLKKIKAMRNHIKKLSFLNKLSITLSLGNILVLSRKR